MTSLTLPPPVSGWLEALIDRHTAALTRPEFLKAVRALSIRYVERRSEMGDRTPTDSAGKRAAFAGFFAPLHFLTTRLIVDALGMGGDTPASLLDLGCGTGVVSAAWALAAPATPAITGIDMASWALTEAQWNWAQLGLRGRTRRGDMVEALEDAGQHRSRKASDGSRGLVLGWSVNELDRSARARLLPAVLGSAERGDAVLIVEPLARSVSPWWPEWQTALTAAGGRADEWKFPAELPRRLADLDEAAGFRRDDLGARSLWLAARRGATVRGSGKTR